MLNYSIKNLLYAYTRVLRVAQLADIDFTKIRLNSFTKKNYIKLGMLRSFLGSS